MKRAFLLAIIFAACKPSFESKPTPQASADTAPRSVHVDPSLITSGRVRTAIAEVRPPRAEAWIPGEIVPSERGEADVTALSSGRVATLDVALGDTVKHGQVVLTLDSPEVGRASAEVLRAKGRAVLAQRSLARQLELDSQQATSKAAIDEARAADTSARADLMAARTLLASLGGYEAQDSDASAAIAPTRVALRSPIDGVVTQRFVALGAPVTADHALLHIVSSSSRVAIAKLPETLDAQATAGTRVRVRPRTTSTETAKDCGAVVLSNLGVVDEARSIPLRIGLDDACDAFASGRYVEVSIPTHVLANTGAMLLVPLTAVTDVRGSPTVFVADGAPGNFSPRGVRLGASLGADVVIESGVVAGDRVVIDGVVLMKGELLKNELQ